MPKRGVAALSLTTLALVLLLNFQTPSDQRLTRLGGGSGTGTGGAVAPFESPASDAAGRGSKNGTSNGGTAGRPGGGTGGGFPGGPASGGPQSGSGDGSAGLGGGATGSTGGSSSGSAGSGSAGQSTQPPSSGPARPGNGTITGQDVQTRFGDVQVQVQISTGKIVDVVPLVMPFDRPRSAAISQFAEPVLRNEALTAQSAQIDVVSGATYTSLAYEQSLQSALDQARG